MPSVIIPDILPYTQSVASLNQVLYSTDWTANYPSDVVVFSRPANTDADDATQQLNGSQFSVAFIGSGAIVQVTLVTPSLAGDIVTITRMTPADRENLYTNTNFTPSMLNNDFGILTLVDQQAQLVNSQIAPRYNYSALIEPVVDTILPILPANMSWRKNSSNTAIEVFQGLDVSVISGVKFLIQQPNSEVPSAQAMSLLATGLVKNTTITGVQSIAVQGVDYWAPGGDPVTVDSGGTGVESFTAFGLIAGGTTSTGALQNAGTGTTDQVYVSGGDSALGSWETLSDYFGQSLTVENDTNITLSLSGTPATALLESVEITAGWTGELSLARGGTNNDLTASAGGILWSDAAKLNILAGTSTANEVLVSGDAATPAWSGLSALMDTILGNTQGDVLYRSASVWTVLAPGTNGQYLTTGGASADPSWTTEAHTGTVTSIATNNGIAGGTITTSGTIGLDTITTLTILSNITGGTAIPLDNTLTEIIDAAIGSTQGDILYRNGSIWTVLAPGTSGDVLTTGGAGADPAWAPTSGGSSPWTASGTNSAYGGGATSTSTTGSLVWGPSSAVTGNYGFAQGNGATAGAFSVSFSSLLTGVRTFGFNYDNVNSGASGCFLIGDSSSNPAAPTSDDQFISTYRLGHFFYLSTNGGTPYLGLSILPRVDAVNYVQFEPNSTTNGPEISAQGADTDINLRLLGKGTGGVPIQGTTDGTPAAVGFGGEVISSVVLFGSPVNIPTSTATNITFIDVTAGCWEIVANFGLAPSNSISLGIGGISATSATLGDPAYSALIGEATNTGFGGALIFPQVNITATTRYYLIGYANINLGTCSGYGYIKATRQYR